MTNDKITQPVEIDETELENASGALPAVQKVREAAARVGTSSSAHGAGGGGGTGKVIFQDIHVQTK